MPYILRETTQKNTLVSKQRLGIVYEWIKDAENGNADAQYNLGMAYFYWAKGFPRSKKKAMYWIKKAAEGGHTSAIWQLDTYKIGSLPAK